MDDTSYFIKGDISGIQDFIFNVKSEKAAKTLKARSFFVQALGDICVKLIEFECEQKGINSEVFYNGGGNFYILVDKDGAEVINKVRKTVEGYFRLEEFYITLNQVKINEEDSNSFGNTWSKLNKNSNHQKLKKFQNDILGFKGYPNSLIDNWEDLTRKLRKSRAFEFTKKNSIKGFAIIPKTAEIEIFDAQYAFLDMPKGDIDFDKSIINKLPRWTSELVDKWKNKLIDRNNEASVYVDSIIDFQALGSFAKDRTGTNRLGILKMDVDDLGDLFSSQKNKEELKKLSGLLKHFFEEEILNLWNASFDFFEKSKNDNSAKSKKRQAPFNENIYPVFSGGDDCFFVGSWDAILHFAQNIKTAFAELAEKINGMTGKMPTISAGVVLVEPTYPVIRFAHLAEEALEKSKTFKYANESEPSKNKICLFDEVLSWEEYKDAATLATSLQTMINNGEPRGIIERIRNSATGFKKLQTKALAGEVKGPGVAKLFYYIRHSKNKEQLNRDLIKPYAKDLMAAFTQRKNINPMKYPVAARWAEFLTRKN